MPLFDGCEEIWRKRERSAENSDLGADGIGATTVGGATPFGPSAADPPVDGFRSDFLRTGTKGGGGGAGVCGGCSSVI